MDKFDIQISNDIDHAYLQLKDAKLSPQRLDGGAIVSTCPCKKMVSRGLTVYPCADPPTLWMCNKGCKATQVQKDLTNRVRKVQALSTDDQIESAYGRKHVFVKSKDKLYDIFTMCLAFEGIEMRYNSRSDMREIRQNGGHWMECNLKHLQKIWLMLSEDYGVKLNERTAEKPLRIQKMEWDAVLSTFDIENAVDPFKLWLESLPKWDGKERAEYMLSTLFMEHPQTPYDSLKGEFGRWASIFPFLAPIQLAYIHESIHPKDQINTRPLFVGQKLSGKSKMLSSLLPPDRPEWFDASFIISKDMKSMVEKMVGTVLLECAEMAGMGQHNRDIWQAFLTSKYHKVRLTWRRDATHYPVKSVVIGTSNDIRCLPASSHGWRRDMPIMLGPAPQAVEPWIMVNREQLWAESLHKFSHGARAGMSYELHKQAMKHTRMYLRRNDHVEDAVARIPMEVEFATTSELLVESGFIGSEDQISSVHPKAVHYFTDALFGQGFTQCEKESEDGIMIRGWQRSKVVQQ